MDAGQSLAVLIEAWVGRSKHNNLYGLAAKTHISYSTVQRTAKRLNEKVSLNTALAILAVVSTDEEQGTYLKNYFPAFYKQHQKNHWSKMRKPEEDRDLRNLDELMAEPMGFMLAQHLLSKAGITTDRVKELYGDLGLSFLNNLDEAKLLQFEDGRWKTDFDYVCPDIEGSRKQIVSAARAFNADTYNLSCGMLNTVSESVSLQGARAITDALQECLNLIRKIRDDNPGKHTFVANLMMQLADPKAAEGEQA